MIPETIFTVFRQLSNASCPEPLICSVGPGVPEGNAFKDYRSPETTPGWNRNSPFVLVFLGYLMAAAG
jgi:hypothetical protein